MTDKPIIMSAPMVRALLEGRKTQTRRVLKPQPPEGHKLVGIYAPHLTAVFNPAGSEHYGNPDEDFSVLLPYRLKQRLWVQEPWQALTKYDDVKPTEIPVGEPLLHVTDRPDMLWDARKRHARFMMRWMSRLTLIVTDVRVERVQDISDEDARAEGCPGEGCVNHPVFGLCTDDGELPSEQFRTLWNSLHKPGFQFDDNPWCCALSFTVHQANVDELREAA